MPCYLLLNWLLVLLPTLMSSTPAANAGTESCPASCFCAATNYIAKSALSTPEFAGMGEDELVQCGAYVAKALMDAGVLPTEAVVAFGQPDCNPQC